MSFSAKLTLNSEEINVLQCGYRFSQVTDNTGRPSAIPRGGTINLVVESNGTTNLFDWMISPTQVKSGSVTFFRRDSMSKLKDLSFSDAYCVDYYEVYNHLGDHPMQIQLTISAHQLKLNDSEFTNNWPQA